MNTLPVSFIGSFLVYLKGSSEPLHVVASSFSQCEAKVNSYLSDLSLSSNSESDCIQSITLCSNQILI